MKHLFLIALLFLSLPVLASDRVTALLSVTNSAGTANGQTITVNGSVRTWTNNVVLAASQIGTNATPAGAKTNAYNQFALNPFTSVSILDQGSTNFNLTAGDGIPLTVTLSAGWGAVSYSTQTVASAIPVNIPASTYPSAPQRTNVESQLIADLNNLSTNAFFENSPAVQNLLGNTNAQTVVGIKLFTNAAGEWFGIITNCPGISGIVYSLTNGVFWTNAFQSPSITNGQNFGAAFRSLGGGTGSEQFGLSASASANNSVAVGNSATASAINTVAVGYQASASGIGATSLGFNANSSGADGIAIGDGAQALTDGATALGSGAAANFTNSTAIGNNSETTAAHQLMFGSSGEYAHFPGNVRIDGNTDLTWKRFPVASLANGNNAGIAVGTNTFVEVSGPSGAFTINGMAGGRDGKFLIVLNQTAQAMTIAHDSGTDPTAANRIYSMTGADQTTTGNGAATFIYSGAANRWIMISFAP